MRVVFLSPFLFRYLRGIERFSVELANVLAERGVEVHLVTWRENRPWPWGGLRDGVVLHSLWLPPYFQAMWAGPAYAFLLTRLRPDVVNLFFTWHGEELTFRLLPRWPFAVNLNLHYPAEEVPHRYQELQRSRIAKLATCMVAVSDYVGEGAREWLGCSPIVIRNGVDLETFRPPENKALYREQLDISSESPVLTTIAALEERKGVHRMLTALPQVVQKYPDLVYVVVGDGPEREKLQEQTESLGLENHVRFLGTVADPGPVYHAADVFIFLSRGEASPLVLLEAMACGLPVLAARRRPLDEFASPKGTIFVDDADPAEIAGGVIQLCQDANRRRVMGQASRHHAEMHFSWDRVAADYLQLFSEELAR